MTPIGPLPKPILFFVHFIFIFNKKQITSIGPLPTKPLEVVEDEGERHKFWGGKVLAIVPLYSKSRGLRACHMRRRIHACHIKALAAVPLHSKSAICNQTLTFQMLLQGACGGERADAAGTYSQTFSV
jgi:hypothetical protein